MNPKQLEHLLACRLIPLDKGLGAVRPIGIGEVLRRIISKSVNSVLKDDILEGTGTLQTSAGVSGGIEAAIHVVGTAFKRDSTEAMLLVDATNAFNSLNRKVALKNIQHVCPTYFRFLNNCYQTPTKLFISGSGSFIYSEEGVTQGDPAAMSMYGLSTNPLINKSSLSLDEDSVQTWYADDSAACGTIANLEQWWLSICEHGPAFGYQPNAAKTILIVKDPAKLDFAKTTFAKYNVTATAEGERHLGAVVGSEQFRVTYIEKKVAGWVEDLKALVQIAEEDPQLAYSAFVKGFSMRWTFIQRTVSGIGHLFAPLESCIRDEFIPKIVGRQVSESERDLFALPLRFGGLGIQNPTKSADREFEASVAITNDLTNLILQQNQDISQLNSARVKEIKKGMRQIRERQYQEELDRILNEGGNCLKKVIDAATEKGSYLWLSALPIKSLGYVLNKIEFHDAVALRYNWGIKGIPKKCSCGSTNDLDHLLTCKKGGFVIMRHNDLRDVESQLMSEAGCRNVVVEPSLIPTRGDHLRGQTTSGNQARVDIAATGIWGKFERTFFDIRVTHPNAPSNRTIDLKRLYKRNEEQKKSLYEDRIVQNEKATFCPLVFSTTGGVGELCERHHKRIAELIASKRNEKYSDVMRYIRTRLCFTLLRSLLMALRGTRGKVSNFSDISDVCFGLIPNDEFYEA